MTPEQWQQVKELFQAALECAPAERLEFLVDACQGDEELVREVVSLLNFDGRAEAFIERPASAVVPELFTSQPSSFVGRRIGPYRIIKEIGHGGMGAVFLAERADEQYQQRVAVKLVKPGFDSAFITNRFLSERQILANLDHPNIANLLDGGTTDDGSPYLVMEFIDGLPIDQYCDAHRLPINERLELFRTVCDAVAHAHRNLVIHRDLKPGNVLVTDKGVPKLLDFGIAKILSPETLPTDHTAATARLMTPDYASPEQVRGDRITTSSDIYSLGVLLYKLLTGHHPYRIKKNMAQEIERVVCSQEPERPSAIVSRTEEGPRANGTSRATLTPDSVSSDRDTQPGRLRRLLGGDLDNIVLMAMRKEPQRRYLSVEQFAEDIRRYLAGLPVIARKDTIIYRTEKFVRRHKFGVAAGILVLLSLIGGIVGTSWQARVARIQRARTEQRFNDVRRLANSFMFEIDGSVQDLSGSTPTRQLLVTRALEYLDSLARESSDDSSLQRDLATAYEKVGDIQGNPYSANLGDTDGALASYRKAIAIREEMSRTHATVDTQIELGKGYRSLGDILEQKGNIAECVNYYRRSLSLFEQLSVSNPRDAHIRDELARAYETLGDGLGRTADVTEKLQSYRQAMAIRQELLTKDPENRKLRRSVAISFMKVGDSSTENEAEGIENLRQAVGMLEELAAADPNNSKALREVGFAYYELGKKLTAAKDYAGALASRRKAFTIRETVAAKDPRNAQARFDLAVAFADLSEAFTNMGEPGQAIASAHKSLSVFESLVVADPTNVVYSRNIGLCYEKLAEAVVRQASDERLSPGQRLKSWTEARLRYRQGLGVFLELRSTAKLMPSDVGEPDRFVAKIKECDEAIHRLKASSAAR